MRPVVPTSTSGMVLGVIFPLTHRDGVGSHWLPCVWFVLGVFAITSHMPDCHIVRSPGSVVRPVVPTSTSVVVLGVIFPLTHRGGVGSHWLPCVWFVLGVSANVPQPVECRIDRLHVYNLCIVLSNLFFQRLHRAHSSKGK